MPPALRFVKGWPPRAPSIAEASIIADVRTTILTRLRLENRYPTPTDVIPRFEELMAT